MNLKKIKMLGVIGVFVVSIICHFTYQFIPNNIVAIFVPVNESIWEHMKMLFSSFIIYGVIEYLLLKRFKIKTNNYLLSLFSMAFLAIPLYLIIFLPIYYRIGENMFVSISLEILVIILMEVLSYYVLRLKNVRFLNVISVILIVICYGVFAYLTFNPLRQNIFLDTESEKYGIDIPI